MHQPGANYAPLNVAADRSYVDFSPQAGDSIKCTVTNTAKPRSLSVASKAATPVDVNGNGITDAGDTIAYTFTAKNTGQDTLSTSPSASSKVGTASCAQTTLAASR